MTTTLKTAIGDFRGQIHDGVVQYRGIKFAKLKDQLAAPEMISDYGKNIVDATQFGPRCISAEACAYEQDVLIQQSLDMPPTPPMSGLDCLNLNIVCPDRVHKKPLPVMVFVHGGGWIIGANWWPQYDPARLVQLSAQMDTPVIVVNINYRLAALGNLTSQELRTAGYPGNNSLRDQKCALQWVQSHIELFGGDPQQICAFGESAGAVSVLMQLSSKQPLFARAISMSGTPIAFQPLELPRTEVAYNMIIKNLGLENASTKERIERITTASPDDIVNATPMMAPLKPYLDGNILSSKSTFKSLAEGEDSIENGTPGSSWCKELMVGDCKDDGNIFLNFMSLGLETHKSGIAARFCASIATAARKAGAAEALLEVYKLSSSTPDDEAMNVILQYVSDIAYIYPALAFVKSWPGKSYYYNFDYPNPFEGRFKGQSTHLLDAAFLFQNYNEKLEPSGVAAARALAQDFIKFANGAAPWQEYDRKKGYTRVYNEHGTHVVESNGWHEQRRDWLARLAEEGEVDLDELSRAWNKFLIGQ
ncbi:putative carboxylesterase [Polyplosphaeria fusca]|uniref:Carboxylesterase n=1 Tax=Polyplosphaeria fusca TaxID=682080 RepID=A0A9P4R6H6_9PLEO|nr:putative carboxylesterase [Polyplosphaeria fusca]